MAGDDHAPPTGPGDGAAAPADSVCRSVLDALDDWLHVVDAELRIVLINDSFKRVNAELGLLTDVVGRRLTEVYPFLGPTLVAEYTRVFASGTSLTTQENTAIGDRTFVTETRKLPISQAGRVTHVITRIRDVTGLRRAEESRRETEGRLQAVFESAQDCIFIKDLDGRYTQVNPAMTRLFGTPAAELLGRTDDELFGGEAAAHIAAVDAAVLAGQVVEEEHQKPVRGEPRVFHIVKAPLRDDQGTIVALCGIARDITERRRAEAERQRLEARLLRIQAAESLGVLAGGVAHDFNNLLTTILGNAELLLATMGGAPAPRRQAQKVIAAARRAADLTQQLLAYAGRGHLASERIDLSTLAVEMVRLLPESATLGRPIACELVPSMPAVEGDPAQVRQVIMSCLMNAVEALGDDLGTVTVRTGTGDLDLAYLHQCTLGDERQAGRYVWIEIEDTGCGIPAADLGRVFDPFFSTKFTGRGLGLAAVLGIVRTFGGAIHVASEPGRGTTFRVLLPAVPADGHPQDARGAAPAP